MADITEQRVYNRQEGDLNDGIAEGIVYAGTLLSFGTNGKVHSAVSGEPFAGIAADNSKDGATVRYWTEGIVDVNCDAAVGIVANAGKQVVASDNNTVAIAADEAANLIVGKIVNINSTTSVRIKL